MYLYRCYINKVSTSVKQHISLICTHFTLLAVLSSFPNDGEEISVDEDQYQYLRLPCSNRPMCVPHNACTFEWKTGDGEGIPTEERIFVDDEGEILIFFSQKVLMETNIVYVKIYQRSRNPWKIGQSRVGVRV